MPFYDSDRFLLAASIFGCYAAYVIIPKLLQEVKDAAASPQPDSSRKDKKLDSNTEDELKIDTLKNLADGHIFDLRQSTIKIVANRTVKSNTRKLLLQDLASENEQTREKAINALWLLIHLQEINGKDVTSSFLDHDSFHAVITALVNLLPSHQRAKTADNGDIIPNRELPPSPIRPTNRPAQEVSLMTMLRDLLSYRRNGGYLEAEKQEHSLTNALTAGLVSRWLVNYPFPCALPENARFNYKKKDIVALFDMHAWANDDLLMSDIMRILTRSAQGLSQLREAGLRASVYFEDVGNTDARRPTWTGEWHVEAMSDLPTEMLWMRSEESRNVPRPRSTERSQEEELLRRRHREAVVVADQGDLVLEELANVTNSVSFPHYLFN